LIGQSVPQGNAAYQYGLTAALTQQDPAFASMVSNYLDVRTVACSVRVQCTIAALNAQGFVHMACVPEDMQAVNGGIAGSWNYPTSLASMERAPFYQKVPLASLINNSATIALPVMDEGAWRYRNTSLVPSQVGNSFLAVNGTPSTLPVQVTMTGTGNTSSGTGTVTFPFAFAANPVVICTVNSIENATQSYEITVPTITTTTFTANCVYEGGSAVTIYNASTPFYWEATGSMTPANAALYYASVGQEVPAQISNYSPATIPGIETTYGWGVCIIALENTGTAANVSPIEVEIIRHYEAIPNDNNGNVITGTKPAPYCPEVMQFNKAVQQETGPVSMLSDTGLDVKNEGGFVATCQRCAQWVSGVSGSLSAFHPALGVVSAVSGAIAGVI